MRAEPGNRAASAPAGALRAASAVRDEILELGLVAERALELAEALERDGRLVQALEVLTAANRLRRDPTVERRLVRLRRAAFATLDRSLPPPQWPPVVPADPPGSGDSPREISAAELTPGRLRSGILRHGCLLVRGLVPPARVARLREAVDRAYDAYEAERSGRATPETTTWYDPIEDVPDGALKRAWAFDAGAVHAADSPRALFDFLETVHELGLDSLIASYFGEPPTLSVEKTMLRRVEPTIQYAGWHQDGAFLGKDVRTVDAWFALSRCGRAAPGMGIVPVRMERILPTGEAGAGFDWSLSLETILRELPEPSLWVPEFEPGDVLFFDHMLIHRTWAETSMTEQRWAIESWFFAPSVYPATSTPLVV